MLKIIPKYFIRYKFLNSMFLGLSVGAIFTLYTPLEPSVYSLGGVLLSLAMLFVARLYKQILNTEWFFRISLFVEVVLFLAIIYFLYNSYSYQTALLMYIGYQITFVFGSYLIRAETLLTKIDTAKQLGYLVGMALSYLFYKAITIYSTSNSQEQVYYLHFLLLALEILVIIAIFKSFTSIEKEEDT